MVWVGVRGFGLTWVGSERREWGAWRFGRTCTLREKKVGHIFWTGYSILWRECHIFLFGKLRSDQRSDHIQSDVITTRVTIFSARSFSFCLQIEYVLHTVSTQTFVSYGHKNTMPNGFFIRWLQALGSSEARVMCQRVDIWTTILPR